MNQAEYRVILHDKGYDNRQEYLEAVADTYGLDITTVVELARFLGHSEDFDGLLSTCADAANTVVMSV